MSRSAWPIITVLTVGTVLGAAAFVLLNLWDGGPPSTNVTQASVSTTTVGDTTSTLDPSTTVAAPSTTTTTVLTRQPGVIPGWTVSQPWGREESMSMFRGNPTRSWYGSGPIAVSPSVRWSYPESPMCSNSTVSGETRVWCGMGWTGQPVAYVRDDGVTEVIFGAYDRAVHFVNGETGQALRSRFVTGDLIKGSVTLDPDGYPLLYFGSRDNRLRILALDRNEPVELWSLHANEVNGIWNNDWDGNPSIIDDIMYVGGENGWFFAYALNRGVDSEGMVTVDPVQLLAMPGYDNELLAKSGRNVSIESSVVAFEERIYFTNSGGRVVGVDVSDIRSGLAPIVFDYYAGGDIDATPIVDQDGYIYVAIEHEPAQMRAVELERNLEVGQLVKFDPYASGDPRVWGIDLTSGNSDSGLWATPALHDGMLYVSTHLGDLIAVDAATGDVVWSDFVGWHSWSSPAVVDDILVVATCLGEVRGYSLSDPREPVSAWTVPISGSCIEATPAILNGNIYIGSRDGFLHALR